jgi:hypothetical protein
MRDNIERSANELISHRINKQVTLIGSVIHISVVRNRGVVVVIKRSCHAR